MAINLTPAPRAGTNAFGMVPGTLSLPDPFGDLSAVYPNLGKTNQSVSDTILSKLSGQLSPSTLNSIQNAAAAFGAANGMPGFSPGTFNFDNALSNIGLSSENLQQQGLQDYNATIPTVSSTQTVAPALQTETANTNAINAAAPDPTQQASYAEQLFNQYLQSLKGPAGGTINAKVPSAPSGFDLGTEWGSIGVPGSIFSSRNPFETFSSSGSGIGGYFDVNANSMV